MRFNLPTKRMSMWAVFFPLALFAASEPGNATKLSSSRQALYDWAQYPGFPLSEINDYRDLRVPRQPSDDDPRIDVPQQIAAPRVIRTLLSLMRAADYEEYKTAVSALTHHGVELTASARRYHLAFARTNQAIGMDEHTSDAAILEAYWILSTKMGAGKNYFRAIALNDSWYRLSVMEELPSRTGAPILFPEDAKRTGFIGTPFSFTVGAQTVDETFLREHAVQVLDVRLLMKTEANNIAYPIGFRLWWNSTISAWIPWYCMEYNIVVRDYCIPF